MIDLSNGTQLLYVNESPGVDEYRGKYVFSVAENQLYLLVFSTWRSEAPYSGEVIPKQWFNWYYHKDNMIWYFSTKSPDSEKIASVLGIWTIDAINLYEKSEVFRKKLISLRYPNLINQDIELVYDLQLQP